MISSKPKTFTDRLVKGPVGFRQMLERLGPIFVKIGQFLALRPDLVPQEYCDELMKLLDRCPPFAWDKARTILREDLHHEPDELFAYIDHQPVAAGSLAQTHLARLEDGTELAVKILRPGVDAQVKRDLRRSRLLARLMEFSGVSLVVSPTEVVAEISGWLMQEIDLAHELENVIRLHGLTRSSEIQRVPLPYPALSTARVLTVEYIRGVPFTKLISEMRSRRGDDRILELGIDRHELATNLMRAVLAQMFKAKFFHADVHPGNLLALPGNIVGFIDFGICDNLDETFRERQVRYLRAVYNDDVDGMFKAILELLVAGPDADLEAFRTDFYAETGAYLSQVSDNRVESSHERSPIAGWMISVVKAARHNRFRFPPRILLMYRTLLTAESVTRQLGSDADLRDVGREFFRRLQLEELVRGFAYERLESIVFSLLTLWRDSPGQMEKILADLARGRLEIVANVSEEPRVRHIRNRRNQFLGTAVASVAVATLLTSPHLPSLFGISLTWPLGALLAFLFLSAFWQWRRLR